LTIETFIGLFILSCIGAYFVWRNNFKIRRANASDKLRAAFAPAFSALSLNIDHTNIRTFFNEESILAQASAIEEFRPYAGCSIPFIGRGIAYQKAWNEYKETIMEKNAASIDPETTWLMNETIEDGKIVKFLPVVKQKIENILHFANH